MQKVVIFTHGIDIDGYGCAVLAKLAYGDDTQILYADNFDLDQIFVKEWKRGWLNNFDRVFITDHCPSMKLCLAIQEDKELLEKTTIFDHHASRLDEQGSLDWVNIVDQNEKGKQSGTSLFFEYLARNGREKIVDFFCKWKFSNLLRYIIFKEVFDLNVANFVSLKINNFDL